MPDPGRNAYRGFEYQIRVTVWLSVTFLEFGAVDTIVIEPLGGEDLHALESASNLDTGERDVRFRAGNIDVQVKSRQADAWGNAELKEILQGRTDTTGPTTRVWPLTRLRADRSLRFLFVTDASVRAELKPLVVDHPAFVARSVPQGDLTKALQAEADDLRGRIGILDRRRLEDVERQAREGLVHGFHVPRLNVGKCFDELVERVRDGLRESSRGELTIAEVHAFARRFGGEPAGPEPFVEPPLMATCRKYLDEKHALILLGEPGVGKTTAAARLIYEHGVRSEPFALREPRQPDDLRDALRTTEPVLVYIEDPFGRSRHEESLGSDWMLAVEEFLSHVSTSRRLLVTSRESFAAAHISPDRTPRALGVKLTLDDGGYDRELLLAEHLKREPEMTPGVAAWIESRRAWVLQQLSRPLSYERLVARASATQEPDRTPALLATIVSEARNAEFGAELEETFARESEAIQRGLAAVWIALRTWPHSEKLDREVRRLEEALTEIDAEVRAAAQRLEKLRWLKRRGGSLYMHPSYEDACLRVIERRPALASKVASRILLMLIKDADYEAAWTSWSAIAGRIEIAEATTLELRRAARAVVKALAAETNPSKSFRSALLFLGSKPTEGEPLDALAAALITKRKTRKGFFLPSWNPPRWPPGFLAEVRANVEAVAIVRAFVRSTFPTIPALHSDGSADELVSFLYSIADVSLEFDALLTKIRELPPELATIIAEGAARSRNADVDTMVREAVAIVAAAAAWSVTLDDVDDDAHAYIDHLAENYQERVAPARAMVDAVLRNRTRGGAPNWASTRSERLVFERFAERAKYEERDLDVLEEVLQACPADLRKGVVAGVAAGDASSTSKPQLAARLLAHVPASDWTSLICRDILRLNAQHPAASSLQEVVVAAAKAVLTFAPFERAALVFELRAPETAPISATLEAVSSETEREAAAALSSMPPALARGVLPLVEHIADSRHPSAIRAIELLSRIGLRTVQRISAVVRTDPSVPRVLECLRLAWRLRWSAEEQDGARLVLEHGLKHRCVTVRELSVQLMEEDWETSTTERLARMVDDPSARVRIALAKAFAGRPARPAWQTLVKLLGDSTDTSDAARYGYPDVDELEYGVAQSAASALADLHVWEPDLEAEVSEFLRSDTSTAGDQRIRTILLAARDRACN